MTEKERSAALLLVIASLLGGRTDALFPEAMGASGSAPSAPEAAQIARLVKAFLSLPDQAHRDRAVQLVEALNSYAMA